MIGGARIAALIPHDGAMCLIGRVVRWDADSICCTAISHRDPANPLRLGGLLPAACGMEYAAQAMALHGALSGMIGTRPRLGYLASLRGVVLHAGRLDDLPGELMIEAERQAADGAHVAYRFRLGADQRVLVEGRASVLLEVGPD